MTDTTFNSALDQQNWEDGYYNEWMRGNQFVKYTGRDTNKIIQLADKLKKNPGDSTTFAFLRRLSGAGQTGDNTLEGNEVNLGNYGHKVTVDQLRQAVRIGNFEQSKSGIDMLNAAKPALLDWDMAKLRDSYLDALGSANVDGSTKYASCSEAQKDAWVTANDGSVSRVLFGNAKGNQSGTDHSASLANVDSSNDTLDTGIIDLCNRMAKVADPHMRPIRTKDGGEWYVMFVPSLAMRDLRADSTMQQAMRDALTRGKDNPLFSNGDLIWGSTIIHEIPEIDVISGVGAAGIDVAPCYYCGAQALGLAVGEKPHFIEDHFDYGNIDGKGISTIRAVDKLMNNEIQHGVLTAYVAGVADS